MKGFEGVAMRLYLIRHGIASERLGSGITRDADRPLTDQGKEEMRVVARGLAKLNVKPDVVLSSPLVRTRETAEILVAEFGCELKFTDALAPGVTAGSVWKSIARYPEADQIVLVGHEPDMGMLVSQLVFAGPEFEMPFKKAGVCRVDVSDIPPTMPGTIKWFIPPKVFHSF